MGRAKDDVLAGVDAALAGDWDRAHAIAQAHEGSAEADWLHAIVHKLEGDDSNSRYWYARCGRAFADFADARAELAALRKAVAG
jgi:hypothetical protein